MIWWLLFLINIFYWNSNTASAPSPKKMKPNRSSEEWCLNNILKDFPRTRPKSKSPSSRSSTINHPSPAFYTPNSSPIPAVVATITSPQNTGPKFSTTPDDWVDTGQDFDVDDLGNGHKMYLPKAELTKYKPSSTKNKLAKEILATMAKVPIIVREFKDGLY